MPSWWSFRVMSKRGDLLLLLQGTRSHQVQLPTTARKAAVAVSICSYSHSSEGESDSKSCVREEQMEQLCQML